jgi:extracellular elastinolytic metalloproteinase
MEQQVAGLRVLDAYVKATINGRGEVVYLVENVAPVKTTTLASPRVSEAQALSAALAALYPNLKASPSSIGRQGNITSFDKGNFFYSSPTVERVAFLTKGGALKTGFMVETWSKSSNLLHETLVDQSGKVQAIELRTNTDRYNIFPNNPTATPQTIVDGPGIGSLESPSGWIFGGPQGSVNISGNNVHAYLDRNADNSPDSFGNRINNGRFLSVADLTTSRPRRPTTRMLPSRTCFISIMSFMTLFTSTDLPKPRAISNRIILEEVAALATLSTRRARMARARTTLTLLLPSMATARACKCICGLARATIR